MGKRNICSVFLLAMLLVSPEVARNCEATKVRNERASRTEMNRFARRRFEHESGEAISLSGDEDFVNKPASQSSSLISFMQYEQTSSVEKPPPAPPLAVAEVQGQHAPISNSGELNVRGNGVGAVSPRVVMGVVKRGGADERIQVTVANESGGRGREVAALANRESSEAGGVNQPPSTAPLPLVEVSNLSEKRETAISKIVPRRVQLMQAMSPDAGGTEGDEGTDTAFEQQQQICEEKIKEEKSICEDSLCVFSNNITRCVECIESCSTCGRGNRCYPPPKEGGAKTSSSSMDFASLSSALFPVSSGRSALISPSSRSSGAPNFMVEKEGDDFWQGGIYKDEDEGIVDGMIRYAPLSAAKKTPAGGAKEGQGDENNDGPKEWTPVYGRFGITARSVAEAKRTGRNAQAYSYGAVVGIMDDTPEVNKYDASSKSSFASSDQHSSGSSHLEVKSSQRQSYFYRASSEASSSGDQENSVGPRSDGSSHSLSFSFQGLTVFVQYLIIVVTSLVPLAFLIMLSAELREKFGSSSEGGVDAYFKRGTVADILSTLGLFDARDDFTGKEAFFKAFVGICKGLLLHVFFKYIVAGNMFFGVENDFVGDPKETRYGDVDPNEPWWEGKWSEEKEREKMRQTRTNMFKKVNRNSDGSFSWYDRTVIQDQRQSSTSSSPSLISFPSFAKGAITPKMLRFLRKFSKNHDEEIVEGSEVDDYKPGSGVSIFGRVFPKQVDNASYPELNVGGDPRVIPGTRY